MYVFYMLFVMINLCFDFKLGSYVPNTGRKSAGRKVDLFNIVILGCTGLRCTKVSYL